MKGKTVLVTGAGGSIGSALCEKLVALGARLKLLSLTENGLFNVTRRLKGAPIEPILGSVTDEGLVSEIVRGVDVVIHAAAHKHVPICQDNPIEAVRNNVFGTETLLEACALARVSQFVLVSTDKAVRPASVMGATKRVAELLTAKAARAGLNASVVRFGNVLDSAGSVLPLWREQIAAGGPITITDQRCERYFMAIPDACTLVLESLAIAEKDGPGLFVFDMGEPVKIVDLAMRLITQMGGDCEIQFTGLRPGEKLTEELMLGGEKVPTSHPKVFRVIEDQRKPMYLLPDLYQAVLTRNRAITERLLHEIAA